MNEYEEKIIRYAFVLDETCSGEALTNLLLTVQEYRKARKHLSEQGISL